MNNGMEPRALAAELTRQVQAKRDFKAPTTKLAFAPRPDNSLALELAGVGGFGVNPKCHNQIADHVGIPRKYYDRMLTEARQKPQIAALLADNVNAWFREQPSTRLVRTIDGNARAFLSDKYRTLDNYDLAEAVLPALQRAGAELVSTDVNENRMFLKAINHSLRIQVKVGDIVEAGISIRNDEIGEGSLAVEPFIFRLVCLNGARIPAAQLRKFHVGRGGNGSEDASEFFKDETLRADDRAFFLKVRDVVEGAFIEEKFALIATQMQKAAEQPIKAKPEQIVEVVTARFGLTEAEGGGILAGMLNDPGKAGYTRWGLSNSITALANETTDYDRSSELEKIGGSIITLEDADWEEVAAA